MAVETDLRVPCQIARKNFMNTDKPINENTNWMVTGADEEEVANRALKLARDDGIISTPDKAAHD
jgi:hypothetical protein